MVNDLLNSATNITASPAPTRTLFVTLLAYAVIVLSVLFGAVMFCIASFAFMTILTKGYGTSKWDPLLVFFIALPLPTLIAGVGLLMRHPWARYYLICLLLFFISWCVWDLLTARASTTTTTSPGGTRTTTTTMGPNYAADFTIILVSSALIVGLFMPSVRAEFRRPNHQQSLTPSDPQAARGLAPPPQAAREWRVGHQGRDRMYYEEQHHGIWKRIDIDGEMLIGTAHHVIYFASPEQWQSYPDWARHRREEIIARIKSEFRPPDYEYQGDGDPPAPATSITPAAHTPHAPAVRPLVHQHPAPITANATTTSAEEERKQRSSLWLVIVILLGITCFMAWLVYTGIDTGTTRLPAKHTSGHVVSRQQEPILFWVSLGTYATVGLGTAGLALWFVTAALRNKSSDK